MPEKSWKVAERRVAKFFGTTRNPLSGGASRHSRSDSLHERLYIETKRKKKYSVITLWDETKLKARKEKKIPIVTLCQHGRPGFWLIVYADDLLDLAEIIRNL